MIYVESAGMAAEDLDVAVVLVHQLRLRGVDAAVRVAKDVTSLSRQQQFDLVPVMSYAPFESGDRLVLVGADKISDKKLVQLKREMPEEGVSCVAFGAFESRQSEIGTQAKLSYILGSEAQMVSTFTKGCVATAPVIGAAAPRANASVHSRPVVCFFDPNMDDPALNMVVRSRKFKAIIVTGGKYKEKWIEAKGTSVPVYHYAEILPSHLSAMVDVCLMFRGVSPNYRMQTFLANLMRDGKLVFDCSEGLGHNKINKGYVQGVPSVSVMASHLVEEILPLLETAKDKVLTEFARTMKEQDRLLDVLVGNSVPAQASQEERKKQGVLIVPTNGVGLGHAQRTSLIAHEFEGAAPVFAAFPSCIPMLNRYGFDATPLVSRSAYHAHEHTNDLANYLRMSAIGRQVSTLVFDGGYVFDSIYRTILDHGLNSVWIRRGMWQEGQNNTLALDREKVFGRVIVPTECFDDLNQSYSQGDHIKEVGPIVQRLTMTSEDKQALRAQLAEQFGKDFRKLVVTMLGGGVAAKRGAQLQAIAGMLDARDDVLNLVVVWPNATVEAGLYGWRNTRVVKTHHASPLAAASDVFISAVGYNSFHESMYNAVPTIFMPQMSAFMDDQRTRAMAAVERGLASCVEAEQVLRLRSEIAAFLDGKKGHEIREALMKAVLPEPGNKQAAKYIEEMAG